jgi:hypothetical protein
MKLTLDINDKLITNAISIMVDEYLFDNFEQDVLKKAKVPSQAKLTKQIVADETCMDSFSKTLSDALAAYMEELIYDILSEVTFPILDNIIDNCNRIDSELEQAEYDNNLARREEARREEERVKEMIKVLEGAGYSVKKA